MKIKKMVLALGLTTLLSGCQGLDNNALMQSGAQAYQAYTLSDDQVKQLSDKSCEQMDKDNQIAPANSDYQQRLNKIAAALGDNI
ncbi:metalloprotease, partial [Pantoea agglomerans]|nr:metalloprotease [Pantoea agglomerans]